MRIKPRTNTKGHEKKSVFNLLLSDIEIAVA